MAERDKKILYCLVSRRGAILADFQESKNNKFKAYTQDILKKIKPGKGVLDFDAYAGL